MSKKTFRAEDSRKLIKEADKLVDSAKNTEFEQDCKGIKATAQKVYEELSE